MSVPTRGPALFAVNTTGVVLSGITCILRCFVRTRIVKGFGLDDWLMAAATVSYLAFVIFSNSGIAYGTGKHRSDLSEDAFREAMKRWFFCYLTYAVSMILVKLSIGYFLLRVTITRLHKWIIYMAAAITCVSCLAFFFLALFQCHPISYFWDKNIEGGICLPSSVLVGLAYVYSVFSVITDLTFALLPAWVVGHLNMDRRAKIAITSLMGMGVVASAAVIVRAPYLQYMGSDDFLWDTAHMAIWSSVETALAITAGCLATLQPLVKMIAAKLGLLSTAVSSTLVGGTGRSGGGGTKDNIGNGKGEILKLKGDISVRREFIRETELFSSVNFHQRDQDEHELKLQPEGIVGRYTAKCYGNTSEEELRPAGVSRTNSSGRTRGEALDSESGSESVKLGAGMAVRAREIS